LETETTPTTTELDAQADLLLHGFHADGYRPSPGAVKTRVKITLRQLDLRLPRLRVLLVPPAMTEGAARVGSLAGGEVWRPPGLARLVDPPLRENHMTL